VSTPPAVLFLCAFVVSIIITITIRSHRWQRFVAHSPGVSTTASPGPLGANAKRCVVGDLMKTRVSWATCSPAPTERAVAISDCRYLWQCAMGWCVVVESYHMAEQWVSPPINDVPVVSSNSKIWVEIWEPSERDFFGPFISYQVIGYLNHSFLVDAGYVNISIADVSEHRLEERWYHVSSAVVGRSTRDSRNDSVSMRVKTQYQTVSILPLNYYDPLLQVCCFAA